MILYEQQFPDPVMRAEYHPNPLPMYEGNPMIEALPDYLLEPSMKTMGRLASRLEPLAQGATRRQKNSWIAAAIRTCFIPLKRHFELHEIIDLMIRQGYQQRDPISTGDYVRKINGIGELQNAAEATWHEDSYKEPLTASVIGCSGIGKTYSTKRCMKLFPQVIIHDTLPERLGRNFVQIVHLTVECPPDGSIKSLCSDIIAKISNLTRVDFSSVYVQKGRPSAAMLKTRVAHLLAVYNVGILIIDEVQNLLTGRIEREQLFNFIVSLSNSLGVPVLFIGTPKAWKLIHTDLRVARRFGTLGVLDWERLEHNSNDWKKFMVELWKYNVLQRETEVVPPRDIDNALYKCSQGITDLLIRLYFLAQKLALLKRQPVLTAELIKQTFKNYFKNVHPMIKAIASDNKQEIAKYQDVVFDCKEYDKICARMDQEINESEDSIEDEHADAAEEEVSTILCGLAALKYPVTDELRGVVEQLVKTYQGSGYKLTDVAIKAIAVMNAKATKQKKAEAEAQEPVQNQKPDDEDT